MWKYIYTLSSSYRVFKSRGLPIFSAYNKSLFYQFSSLNLSQGTSWQFCFCVLFCAWAGNVRTDDLFGLELDVVLASTSNTIAKTPL